MLVDDYGHHPTEIKTTIDAVRGRDGPTSAWSWYSAHRYTRTRDLYEDFVQVLAEVDLLIVLAVTPPERSPLPEPEAKTLRQYPPAQ